MNINFIINLNDKEKELMVRQCVKEFRQAEKASESLDKKRHEIVDKYNGLPPFCEKSTIERKKLCVQVIQIDRERNINRMRKLAICDIAIALNLCIRDKVISRDFYGANIDNIGERFINFYDIFNGPYRDRLQNKDKPYYRKLAIYMMCRAGVIAKVTRDRMLQLLKTKTPIQLQERTQRKVNKLQEAFMEFRRKINGIVSHDEAKEIAKECGLHRYMVKKYGIEAVTSACCGTTEYTEPCGI